MVKQKEKRIFISCSKDDKNLEFFKDIFLSREVDYKPIFMELENIKTPPYSDIKKEINNSARLFVLLSSALTEPKYLHTANWVSFEIGLASNKTTICPVMVFEPFDEYINFAVPYASFFFKYYPDDKRYRNLIRNFLKIETVNGLKNFNMVGVSCPNIKCKLEFIYVHPDNFPINCPSCKSQINDADENYKMNMEYRMTTLELLF